MALPPEYWRSVFPSKSAVDALHKSMLGASVLGDFHKASILSSQSALDALRKPILGPSVVEQLQSTALFSSHPALEALTKPLLHSAMDELRKVIEPYSSKGYLDGFMKSVAPLSSAQFVGGLQKSMLGQGALDELQKSMRPFLTTSYLDELQKSMRPLASIGFVDQLQASVPSFTGEVYLSQLELPRIDVAALVHSAAESLADAAEARERLREFETVVKPEVPESPLTLGDWLYLLPGIAERRLLLLALAALAAVVNVGESEAGIQQPAHIDAAINVLLAVAIFLSEYVEYRTPRE